MKLQKKGTNERASEYYISIAFPFSNVTISKPRQKLANQWACSEVRVTNSCTLVHVNVYVYDLTLTHFQQKL
jgi:hypothetical protein